MPSNPTPRLGNTLRNTQAAFDLLYRQAGIDWRNDHDPAYSAAYEAANEAAIGVLSEAYASVIADDEDANIPEQPDRFGEEIGDTLQGLLVLACLRSEPLAEHFSANKLMIVARPGQRVYMTQDGLNEGLSSTCEWRVRKITHDANGTRYWIITNDYGTPDMSYWVPESCITLWEHEAAR